MFKRKVRLPQTQGEYDHLVAKIVNKYRLADSHHASVIISHAIRHLPATQAYTTLDYLGHFVLKNIANHIADVKCNNLRHESQIDLLVACLRQDPTDAQARDKLQLAANDGSEYAKAALEKVNFDSPVSEEDVEVNPPAKA